MPITLGVIASYCCFDLNRRRHPYSAIGDAPCFDCDDSSSFSPRTFAAPIPRAHNDQLGPNVRT